MALLEAVLEIGSTGIRLMVAEINSDGLWSVIDRSEAPIPLGWDVFTTEHVSRDTLLQCLRILNRFKEQLNGWSIDENHTQVIATSALREAKNRDTVLDRIFVKTGFKVKVIDGIEENRLMYIAVLESLHNELPQLRKHNSLILEIGGGSTEIMLMDHGKMAAVHSIRLGTVIIEQNMKSMLGSIKDARRFLEEFIRNTGVNLNTEINLSQITTFITIGSEAKIAAQYVGEQISPQTWTISRDKYNTFVDEVQEYSTEECMAQFNISYNDAKGFIVGLLTYKLFLSLTNAQEITVTNTSIREGLIISRISSPNAELQQEFFSQIVEAARNLGRKYRYDESHAEHVRTIALKIFDKMKEEIGLNQQGRRLLEVSALLHDIGNFIRGSDHHLHSEYIIAHSDIFGLSKDDMSIISLVARYHRGGSPSQRDTSFAALPRADRVSVLKLAALLRVADALDRSHTQKIIDFEPEFRGEQLILKIEGTQDTSLEKIALAEKSGLFESVFGYNLIIV